MLTIDAAPDGSNPSASALSHMVWLRGKPLIERSSLRLEFEGRHPLGPDVRVLTVAPSSGDDTYRLAAGKASEVRTHYNALRVDLEEVGGLARKFSLEMVPIRRPRKVCLRCNSSATCQRPGPKHMY